MQSWPWTWRRFVRRSWLATVAGPLRPVQDAINNAPDKLANAFRRALRPAHITQAEIAFYPAGAGGDPEYGFLAEVLEAGHGQGHGGGTGAVTEQKESRFMADVAGLKSQKLNGRVFEHISR